MPAVPASMDAFTKIATKNAEPGSKPRHIQGQHCMSLVIIPTSNPRFLTLAGATGSGHVSPQPRENGRPKTGENLPKRRSLPVQRPRGPKNSAERNRPNKAPPESSCPSGWAAASACRAKRRLGCAGRSKSRRFDRL